MGKVKKRKAGAKPPAADPLAGLGEDSFGFDGGVIHPDELRVYRDALSTYNEAQANIAKNGAVSAHPKTGAPFVNPYLAIRTQAGAVIQKFHKDNPGFKDKEAPAQQ